MFLPWVYMFSIGIFSRGTMAKYNRSTDAKTYSLTNPFIDVDVQDGRQIVVG